MYGCMHVYVYVDVSTDLLGFSACMNINHHLLETGCKIRRRQRSCLGLNSAKHGCFQTAEGEVIGMKASLRKGDASLRKLESTAITTFRCGLNGGATRVAEAQQARHLVKGLPCRIVMAAAKPLHGPINSNADQLGVPTTDQQHQVGRLGSMLRQMH
mgnify:CR=1 FL=1